MQMREAAPITDADGRVGGQVEVLKRHTVVYALNLPMLTRMLTEHHNHISAAPRLLFRPHNNAPEFKLRQIRYWMQFFNFGTVFVFKRF